MLLKIYIYGYLNRIQSSRRLEREAQRNLELIWLTGRQAPDFKTIADFRRDSGEAIGKVCSQFILPLPLGDLGAGRIFHPTLARALRHVGAGVLAGSLLKVFAATNLTRLLVEMRGSVAWFDMSAIVLGVVGAALTRRSAWAKPSYRCSAAARSRAFVSARWRGYAPRSAVRRGSCWITTSMRRTCRAPMRRSSQRD